MYLVEDGLVGLVIFLITSSDITYYTVNDIQLTIDDEKSIVLEECEVGIVANRKDLKILNHVDYRLKIRGCELSDTFWRE